MGKNAPNLEKKGPDLNLEALLSEAFTSNDILLLTNVINTNINKLFFQH